MCCFNISYHLSDRLLKQPPSVSTQHRVTAGSDVSLCIGVMGGRVITSHDPFKVVLYSVHCIPINIVVGLSLYYSPKV